MLPYSLDLLLGGILVLSPGVRELLGDGQSLVLHLTDDVMTTHKYKAL